MDGYTEANKALWNTWTRLHEGAAFYDVAAFKAGATTLRPIDRPDSRVTSASDTARCNPRRTTW